MSQLEGRWPPAPANRKRAARALRSRLGELLKPLLETVHPASLCRLVVEVSPNEAVIPEHAVAPAISAALDGEKGLVHQLYSTLSSPAVELEPPMISHGLTVLCHPTGLANEKWTPDLGAGGNLYAEEEHHRLHELANRQSATIAVTDADDPKKRPIATVRRDAASAPASELAKLVLSQPPPETRLG